MAAEGQYTWKFQRKYRGYNPAKYTGPTTEILDTVLRPKYTEEEKK